MYLGNTWFVFKVIVLRYTYRTSKMELMEFHSFNKYLLNTYHKTKKKKTMLGPCAHQGPFSTPAY